MQQNIFRGPFGTAALVLLAAAGCVSESREVPPHHSTDKPREEIPTPEPPAGLVERVLPHEMALFNGKDLHGWRETDFGAHGEISVTNGEVKIKMGGELTGINWTNAAVLPKTNYEIELDAMKLEGNDFFCGLTFPVGKSFCSLIVGGWGGGIVGISSINGADASENDTTRNLFFERNRWYHLRVRVTPQKIMAWIDQDNVVDVEIEGRKVAMRGGDIELSVPLGIATWQTSAAFKNIKLKSF